MPKPIKRAASRTGCSKIPLSLAAAKPRLRKVIAQETHLPQRLITQELDHYLKLIRSQQSSTDTTQERIAS